MTADEMGHLLRSHRGRRASVAAAAGLLVAFTSTMRADDWPEWRGAGRVAVWKETGLLERFPEAGLKVTWRTPVHAGYSGPAVANGRVYVTDARTTTEKSTVERVLALDELRGR
jgi:hypothetical protein